MGRRNNIDIYADILQVAKYGVNKTGIVYRANLNFNIVKKYLHSLIDNDLLDRTEDRLFVTTEKGVHFLEQYKEFMVPINKM